MHKLETPGYSEVPIQTQWILLSKTGAQNNVLKKKN